MAGNPLHNTESSPLTYSPFIFSPGGGRSGRRKGPTIFQGTGRLVCNAYLRMNMAATMLAGTGLLAVNEYQRQKWSGSAAFAGAGNLSANPTLNMSVSAKLAGTGNLAATGSFGAPVGGPLYQLLFAA